MATSTRSNGFPSLNMSNTGDQGTQPRGPAFQPTWQSGGIWGNGPLSSSLNTHREVPGSRGSAEASPTAGPSGSAQLNPRSEAVRWTPRGPVWQPTNSSSQAGPSQSGGVSPTRTRDSFQYGFAELGSNSQIYQPRAPIPQTIPAIPSRTLAPGPVDASASSRLAFRSEIFPEDKGNSVPSGAVVNSQRNMDQSGMFRRNSTDPNHYVLGSNRPNGMTSRPSDSEVTTQNGSQYLYGRAPGHTSSRSRASVPSTSVTLAPEAGRGNGFNYGSVDAAGPDLVESFGRALNLDDRSDLTPSTNGYTNSSQPFEFNPGSEPWRHDLAGNSRGMGQGPVQQEYMLDQYVPKRDSLDRSSPAGSAYRPNLNSPTASSGTPNPRGNPWSRPGSRGRRMNTDAERQLYASQFLQQPATYYSSPYYNPALPQFPSPYEQYVQQQQQQPFRPQLQPHGYGMPSADYLGGIPVPWRAPRDQDPGRGVRSMLLEEFRTSGRSTRRYDLPEIYGHIVEFSGDQHGSRFIQEKLQGANSDEKDQVFREIEPNTVQLMKDVFGNYVIQKFFEHGNQVQKKIIAAQMKGKVAELSRQMYACRVVQKALEHILVEQQAEIVEELRPDIMAVVKDQNGNHVIQKMIQLAPRLCIPFIMDAFRGQIEQLSSHNYGCRVIQRILEHGTDVERKSLMAELNGCTSRLITDQYGNYVVQHIIEHGEPDDRSRVIRIATDRVLILSKHKFASNVIEKCVEFGTVDEVKAIRAKLTELPPSGTGSPRDPSPLEVMMKDQYGNYVIQKLVQESPDREEFLEILRPRLEALANQTTGRAHLAVERVLAMAMSKPSTITKPGHTANGVANGAVTTSPTTPLLVEVGSTAPTPSLTMEQDSPQSDSPPSTNISTLGESVDDKKVVDASQSCPDVRVDEA
ncbi:ARM repeat-containing protein [Xylariaceae sp. FL0804]|nr:ARM repeat-containing protein [Xylariaceae sp. FL0804]